MIAFANAKGGTVYLGIEDNGEVTGCTGNYDLQNIVESIYDKTRPGLFTEIKELEYEGKKVISLSVEADGITWNNICDNRWKMFKKARKKFKAILSR